MFSDGSPPGDYKSDVNLSPKSESSATDRAFTHLPPHERPTNGGNSGGSGNSGLRTCFQSSTRWFQLLMFAAAVVALAMAMLSSYQNLSPGLVWGGLLSALSVFFVIVSYVSVPAYRQHPNPIMFWRTVADAFFVLQLLTQQFVRCVFFGCNYLCNADNLQCKCSTDPKAGTACT